MGAAGDRDRERSHWGWGYADRSPDRATLEALAPELRRRLGFGGDRIEEPVPLEAVEIAPPRLQPPDSLAPILSDAPADRLRHAMGRAYRDVVRGFRGRFERTPDLVAFPQDEEDVRRVLELCAERRLAAIPFGGGTSVVGGVEPRIGRGYRGTVSIDLGGLSGIAALDEVSGAALIRAGTLGPDLEDGLRPHGLTAQALPAVVRVLDARRLDRDPRRRPFRDRADPHRRPRRLDPRPDPVGAVGEPSPARIGRRPEPRPDAAGIGGHPRRHHRGLGPGPPAADLQGVTAGLLPVVRGRCRGRPGDRPVRPEPVELPPARPARGRDDGRRRRLRRGSDPRVRVGLRPRRPPPSPRRRMRRRSRGHARAGAGGIRRGGRGLRGADLALGVPRRALPPRQPRRAGGHQRDLRDRDHVGSVRRVPLPGRRGRPPRRRRGHRRARRGGGIAAGDVPLHPRLPDRAGALLHGPRQGPPRIRGRAVGRDQGGGLGGDRLRRRHDHPPSRRRPRSSPLVRPPAAGSLRRRARRREASGRSGGDPQPRGADRSGARARRPRTDRFPGPRERVSRHRSRRRDRRWI